MKILMIVHGFAPECSGGTESYVLRCSRELVNRGHTVEVFCGSHEGAGPGVTEPRLEVFHHQELRIHRIHRTGLFVDSWEKGLAPEVEPVLDALLADLRPDLVHVHHWIRMTRNLVELCHDRGVPAVCTLHDLWTTCPQAFRVHDMRFRDPGVPDTPCPLCAPAGESMTELEKARELELFRDDFANEVSLARRVIVPSLAHRDLIRACHPGVDGRLRVVPHGDILPFKSSPRPRVEPECFPAGPLVIGHWGHLSLLKGVDILLEALLRIEDPARVRLELFGEIVYPDEQDRIEDLLDKLPVKRHGSFAPRDLLDVPIDLAVIPTRCSESWSFVLSEAFLLGLPAIVPARGALEERLEGAGATFAPEDPDALAARITAVLETPRLLEEWRANIPSLQTPEEHAEALERVYQEVVTSRARLPVTPPDLRARRLLGRSLQVESRNRLREADGSLIRNLQSDAERAQASLEEMDHYHRLKDRELARLYEETDRKSELIGAMASNLQSLLDSVESLERRRLAASDAQAASPSKKRLKVLMVVHQFLPRHVAGTEVYCFNLSRELSRNHDVLILTAESDHSRPRFEEERLSFGGIPVHQVIHNYEWESFQETYDCPEADAIFRRLLREEKPDIVHIQHLHYWSANFITIAKKKKIPVVYTLHDFSLLCPRDGQMRREDGEICKAAYPSKCADCISDSDLNAASPPALPRALHPGAEALLQPGVAATLRRVRERVDISMQGHEAAIADRLTYLKSVISEVDLFISPSRFLRDLFVENELVDPGRIIVSDNGIDVGAFYRADKRSFPTRTRLRVGYVGTIAEHKGLDTLADAMNLIEDERITCHIWGNLNAFHEYTSQLRDRIANPRTLLMGPFPNERIEEVLMALDVLVIPSLWYENSPITIHEAALAGLPVIVSDLGGMAEYVHEGVTGLKFPMGDAGALAATLRKCLEDPDILAAFDPSAFEIKTAREDAVEMERRYRDLLTRARAGTVAEQIAKE